MLYAWVYPFFPEVTSVYCASNPVDWEQLYKEDILIVCESGHATFYAEAKEYEVGPGDMLFVRRGTPIKRVVVPERPFKMYYIHFVIPNENRISITGNSLDEIVNGTVYGSKLTNRESIIILQDYFKLGDIKECIISEINQMYELLQVYRFGYNYTLNSIFQKIIGIISSEIIKVRSRTKFNFEDIKWLSDRRMEKFANYIYDNVSNKITLKDLSEKFNYTQQYIISLFKEHFNMTPIKYINMIKILYAKEMIRKKQYSIKEIAEMTGYENTHYFSKVFKTVSGCSPTEYKRKFEKKQ